MTRPGLALLAFMLLPGAAVYAAPQSQGRILSSEIAISRDRAEIKLEFEDGRKATFATISGSENRIGMIPGAAPMQRAGAAGNEVISLGVTRGDLADRSWRELLNAAMAVEAAELATLLKDWNAPSGRGAELFDQTLEAALAGDALPANAVASAQADADLLRQRDSLAREVARLKEVHVDRREHVNRKRGPDWLAPIRHVGRGISGLLATFITYAVLFGLGFVTVMFGGRKYIEGVADTARGGIGRAFLVGLAGTFLLLPVYVLGIIALAISIVGIPALLVWVPLFPIGAISAAVLGFLAVAHAAGESWAERRHYGSEWFTRANSYYFMASGLTLLSALFMAAHVITMAGPWLGFINNILNFFGIMLTWAAVTIGFGAVLISRGGSRVAGQSAVADAGSYSEANV